MIIVVRGTPAPQGSKRHVGGGRMVEMSKAVGPWREAVRGEVQRAMGQIPPLEGPVSVMVDFIMAKPKSAPKRMLWPAKRPDLDKLVRAVLDGMTMGGAFGDDSQVVALSARKLYADPGMSPGCEISFEPVITYDMNVPVHAPLHDIAHTNTRKDTTE